MSRETSPTRDEMIRDDTAYALTEAFQHVTQLFGTPSSHKEKTRDEYEEDQKLKIAAFTSILDALLGVYLAWTDEEVET